MHRCFPGLTEQYTVEYINDITIANKRLWHNSYDILLLEEQFSKDHTLKLSKMSYAMSRPSIILCNNAVKLYMYKLWKHLSNWTNRFITSKKLIFFIRNNDSNILSVISDLANHHQYFNIITKEICSNISFN